MPNKDLKNLDNEMKKFSIEELNAIIGPEPSQTEPAGLGEQITRGAIETIPILTGMGGAALGTGLGPAGTVGGGALGYAGGKSLTRGLLGSIYGDKVPSLKESLIQVPKDLAEGASMELGGQLISKAITPVGKIISSTGSALKQGYKYTRDLPKSNAEGIIEAGKLIGVTPTKGMLTSNPLIGQLESGLAQSGSIPAMEIRAQQDLLWKQLENAKGKIPIENSQQTAYETGNIAKQSIQKNIELNKTPVTEMYNALEKDFLNIPIDLKTANREFGILKKSTMFKTKDGEAILNNAIDDVSRLDNLASLKEYRTNLLRSIPSSSSDLDKIRMTEIYHKITDIRNNSIAALQNQPEFKFAPKGARGELAQVVDQITLADSAHKTNMDQINKVRHLFGQKEPFKSSSEFVKKVQEIPNQNLTEKIFSSGNVDELKNFSSQFPEAFSQMKIQKFSDMIQKSTNREGFNFNQFQKTYEKIDPKIKELIFDPETQSYISALKTVFESLPNILGPSGTPQGLMTMNSIDKGRILNDMWSKYIYKNSTPQGVMILNTLGEKAQGIGAGLQKPFGAIPNMTRIGIGAASDDVLERRKKSLNQVGQ